MITVIKEPVTNRLELEHCCFCRKKTDTWHAGNDVACCRECAEIHDESEVPTKKEWCDKEKMLMGRE